jgi:NAD(P)-dependent dehydrogenase (short-subunit alcohol dehydrogenase family)
MYVVWATLPGMVARGWGRVITVVSDAGRVGERGLAAYSAAKAGAAGLAAADPAFHDRVHPRRLDSGAGYPGASGLEDCVERGGEAGVPVM